MTSPASERQAQASPLIGASFGAGRVVAISPSIGIAAWNYKGGAGAWRFWVLARALDRGEGADAKNYCHLTQIREALDYMGVSARTFFYWMRDAEKFGLVRVVSGRVYYIAENRVASVFCAHMDKRRAKVELGALFAKGWKQYVWASYIKANHDGNRISRNKLHDLTGVSFTRQRSIDKLVKRQQNIAVTEDGAEHLQGYRDFTKKASPFLFNDGKQENVAYHLPARVSVRDEVALVGTAPKSNHAARHYPRTYPRTKSRRANSEWQTWRLFYEREPRLLQGAARFSDPDEVFVRRSHSSRVQVWDARALQKTHIITPVLREVRIVGKL